MKIDKNEIIRHKDAYYIRVQKELGALMMRNTYEMTDREKMITLDRIKYLENELTERYRE